MAVNQLDIQTDIEDELLFPEKSENTIQNPILSDEDKKEAFLNDFEDSLNIEKKDLFKCAITREVMYDPVTVSSGQTYSRAGVIMLIENAFKSGTPSICPNTRQPLTPLWQGSKEDISAYMMDNLLLKTLISSAIADFKKSEPGEKYKDFKFDPTEKIRPIAASPASANRATPLFQDEQYRPYNRNRFFTQDCVELSNTLNAFFSLLISAGSMSAVDNALPGACCTCPKCAIVTVSFPLTCVVTTALCFGVIVGSAECEKRFCLEEALGSASESLVMNVENDEESHNLSPESSSSPITPPAENNVSMNENNLSGLSVEPSNVSPNILTMEEEADSTLQTFSFRL